MIEDYNIKVDDMAISNSHFWYSVNGKMLIAAWKRPQFKIGLTIIIGLLLLAIILPLISSTSATTLSVRDRFAPPIFLEGGTFGHLFGTDQLLSLIHI